jgi:hypothetical protein
MNFGRRGKAIERRRADSVCRRSPRSPRAANHMEAGEVAAFSTKTDFDFALLVRMK